MKALSITSLLFVPLPLPTMNLVLAPLTFHVSRAPLLITAVLLLALPPPTPNTPARDNAEPEPVTTSWAP